MDRTDPEGREAQRALSLENSNANSIGKTPRVAFSHANKSSNRVMKPSTTPVSSVSKNGTVTTVKPIVTSKTTTGVSTDITSTTLESTRKITSVWKNIPDVNQHPQ